MPQIKCPYAAATGAWPALHEWVTLSHWAQAYLLGSVAQGASWNTFARHGGLKLSHSPGLVVLLSDRVLA